jgi:hypothetical protein
MRDTHDGRTEHQGSRAPCGPPRRAVFLTVCVCARVHGFCVCRKYDHTKCYAYPRKFYDFFKSQMPDADGFFLGADVGYNYNGGNACNFPMSDPVSANYHTGQGSIGGQNECNAHELPTTMIARSLSAPSHPLPLCPSALRLCSIRASVCRLQDGCVRARQNLLLSSPDEESRGGWLLHEPIHSGHQHGDFP